MKVVSKITLATFDFNKHLTIKYLSHVASSNIGKNFFFLFSYILLLSHLPKGL